MRQPEVFLLFEMLPSHPSDPISRFYLAAEWIRRDILLPSSPSSFFISFWNLFQKDLPKHHCSLVLPSGLALPHQSITGSLWMARSLFRRLTIILVISLVHQAEAGFFRGVTLRLTHPINALIVTSTEASFLVYKLGCSILGRKFGGNSTSDDARGVGLFQGFRTIAFPSQASCRDDEAVAFPIRDREPFLEPPPLLPCGLKVSFPIDEFRSTGRSSP
jgi:hypothetical protein